MTDSGIEALLEAIKDAHGVEATWLESVPVKEVFHGHIVWDGEVQVYDLVGHPTAKRAYTWSHEAEGAERRLYVVLGPVADAATAVRAAIASDARAGGR